MALVRPRYSTPTGVRVFAKALSTDLPRSLRQLRRLGRQTRTLTKGRRGR